MAFRRKYTPRYSGSYQDQRYAGKYISGGSRRRQAELEDGIYDDRRDDRPFSLDHMTCRGFQSYQGRK